MKILAIADEEARYLYDYYSPGKLEGVDLILACGDLHPEYLEFLVTMANVPLFYVRGNHDDYYSIRPPEGCECIEDKLIVWNGIRILGLGGAFRYRKGDNLYSEYQMRHRVAKLWLKIRYRKGFDILLTHAPARYVNDLEDLPHRGFQIFRDLMERYSPKYFIHGHVHANYGIKIPQWSRYCNTTVLNAYNYVIFDYE